MNGGSIDKAGEFGAFRKPARRLYIHRALQELTAAEPGRLKVKWTSYPGDGAIIHGMFGEANKVTYAANPLPDAIKAGKRFLATKESGAYFFMLAVWNEHLLTLVVVIMARLAKLYDRLAIDSPMISDWERSRQAYIPHPDGDAYIDQVYEKDD